MTTATLGYWGINGVCSPIRILLHYLNVDYTEKTYSGLDWFGQDKQELDLLLPNLPYYIDEDMQLTESQAISYYLIKKNRRMDLLGQQSDSQICEKEVRVNQIMNALYDLRDKLFVDVKKLDFLVKKNQYFKDRYESVLDSLIQYLGEKEYLVNTLTYADFMFYELLKYFQYFYPEFKVPKHYFANFENIQGIKQYLSESSRVKDFIPQGFFEKHEKNE